jgi:5-carboxymethyl-2-hydroxymuconate isomerase
MPQVTFEYTSNISQLADYRRIVLALHELIVREIATDLASCKTRLVEVGDFVIADGAQDQAFIHVAIAILSGRTWEQKASLSEKALALVAVTVPEERRRQTIQITVEIRDLDSGAYRKQVVAGSDSSVHREG